MHIFVCVFTAVCEGYGPFISYHSSYYPTFQTTVNVIVLFSGRNLFRLIQCPQLQWRHQYFGAMGGNGLGVLIGFFGKHTKVKYVWTESTDYHKKTGQLMFLTYAQRGWIKLGYFSLTRGWQVWHVPLIPSSCRCHCTLAALLYTNISVLYTNTCCLSADMAVKRLHSAKHVDAAEALLSMSVSQPSK